MSRRMQFGRFDVAACGTFVAYAACSLVVPVALVAMGKDLGFPLGSGGMAWAGSLQAARSVTIIAAMLSCGFLAGRWGLRLSIGAALCVMGAGLMVAGAAPSFVVLLLAVALAGLGEGVIEALGTPAVQQLHPDQPGRYINFTHGFWSIGVLGSVLAVGWLLSRGLNWRLLIVLGGATALLPAAIFLSPRRGVVTPLDTARPLSGLTVAAQTVDIARRGHFWLFFAAMFFAGGGEFALTFWTASFIQLEFVAQPWAGGVGTACFAAGMILGRLGWGYLLHQHHLWGLLMGSSLAGAAISLLLPWVGSLGVLFSVLFLAGIAVGPFWPSLQSYSTDRLPVDTTMLFILLSCAGIPGCGAFT